MASPRSQIGGVSVNQQGVGSGYWERIQLAQEVDAVLPGRVAHAVIVSGSACLQTCGVH
jgi:hypothetical protein